MKNGLDFRKIPAISDRLSPLASHFSVVDEDIASPPPDKMSIKSVLARPDIGEVLRKPSGAFTIIELMVVIVIIALLSGITIVSYGAWRQSLANKEVQQNLSNVAQGMKNELSFHNAYPNSLPGSFTASSGVTVTLASSSATAYCAEAVSVNYSSVIYHVDNTSTTPVAGAC